MTIRSWRVWILSIAILGVTLAVVRGAIDESVLPGPSDREELLATRERVWRAWFGGDAATLRSLLPPETIALESGPQGWLTRDVIIQASLDFAKAGNTLLSLEFPRTEIQTYGHTAIIYTSYAYVTDGGGKRQSAHGKAIEIFVRQDHGWVNSGWQMVADPGKVSER